MALSLPVDPRRRILLLLGAVAVLVLAVLLVVRLTGDAPTTVGSTAGPTADPGGVPTPTASPAPDPSSTAVVPGDGGPAEPAPTAAPTPGPTLSGPVGELAATVGEIEAGQDHLAPVEAGEIAQTPTGVTVSLDAVERVDAQASGPGEIAGPALALTVTLTNGSAGTLTLDDVVVNLYGQEGAPGSLFPSEPRTRPLAGELAPGARSTGTYVVSVPSSSSGRVIASVFVGAGVPSPLFTTVLEES